MGLMSTLALLSLPLMKRTTPSSPPTIDPQVAALKARVAELETEVDDLQRKLDDANRDATLARRAMHDMRYELEHARLDRDYWYGIIQTQRAAQSPNYAALQQYQNARSLAQQAQMQSSGLQSLGLQAQQLGAWHDCTCIPGRASTFGIRRRNFGVLRGDDECTN